jgi:soluble lytic murein transglycosylase
VKQAGLIMTLLVAGTWLYQGQAQAYSRDDFSQQRSQFIAAEQAAKHRQWTRFESLAAQLQDYPLYPYLEYQQLSRRLSQTDDQAIRHFISQNAGSPLANQLQHKWLYSLARHGKWQSLANNFAYTHSRSLQCLYIKALIKLNQHERAFNMLEATWLTGKSLPRTCDQPIALWHKQSGLTQDRVWQRIRLSMQAGHSRLARYLAKEYLNDRQRYWVSVWSKVRRHPDYVVQVHQRFQDKSEQQPAALRWLLIDGLRRMAYAEPVKAAELWSKIQPQYPFTLAETQRLERRLATKLVEANSGESRRWLKDLNLNTEDNHMRELFALSALRDRDWPAALQWLNRIEGKDEDIDRWRYWRARCLESLGRLDEARQLYLQTSDVRSYYSFLSADRAGLPYRFANRPLHVPSQELSVVKSSPAVARAAELFWLNRVVQARREWRYALQNMDRQQMLQAAQLAHRWGWYDRSIVTLSEANYWDDLEKRFPLAHRDLVEKYASRNRINPAWAYAIIRQESAFISDARSHAGALGLMQLLPRTARQVARSLRLRRPKQRELISVNTNIRLGIGYLNKVQRRFQGNPVLATAAYNAGGYRVKSWLPEEGSIPADLWVELVPFNETRDYLQRVLTYTVIYEQRLGMNARTLLERMSPIQGPVTVISKDDKLRQGPESSS